MCSNLQGTATLLLYADVCLLRPESITRFIETMSYHPERWDMIKRLCLFTDRTDASHRSAQPPSPLWSDSIMHILSQYTHPLSNMQDAATAPSVRVPSSIPPAQPSWTLLQVIALRLPVDHSVERVMQALNAIPHLRELWLIWQLPMSTLTRIIRHEGISASHRFPLSPGLQLPFLRKFSWDSKQNGIEYVLNMNAIHLLTSSQFMPSCDIRIRGHIGGNSREEAECFAAFFQRHAHGTWDLSDLAQHGRPWGMSSALKHIRGRLLCSLRLFVLCLHRNSIGFPPAGFVDRLPRELTFYNDLHPLGTSVLDEAFEHLYLRTAASSPTTLRYVDDLHLGASPTSELPTMKCVKELEIGVPRLVLAEAYDAIHRHVENLRDTNMSMVMVQRKDI